MDGSSQCQADAATITPGLVIDRGRERGREKEREGEREGVREEMENGRQREVHLSHPLIYLSLWAHGRKKEKRQRKESRRNREKCNVKENMVLKSFSCYC